MDMHQQHLWASCQHVAEVDRIKSHREIVISPSARRFSVFVFSRPNRVLIVLFSICFWILMMIVHLANSFRLMRAKYSSRKQERKSRFQYFFSAASGELFSFAFQCFSSQMILPCVVLAKKVAGGGFTFVFQFLFFSFFHRIEY
jgi:hypothetical protein